MRKVFAETSFKENTLRYIIVLDNNRNGFRAFRAKKFREFYAASSAFESSTVYIHFYTRIRQIQTDLVCSRREVSLNIYLSTPNDCQVYVLKHLIQYTYYGIASTNRFFFSTF